MIPVAVPWAAHLTGPVRANPAYRLHSLAVLPSRYTRALEQAGVDTGSVFGLLVAPRATGLPAKVVDRVAARIFTDLGRPGRPPPEVEDRLAALVLDGVLEVEQAGRFVSGPVAYDTVHEQQVPDHGETRLGRLSAAALDYAERLDLARADDVTARLYAYHRLPWSARWARTYPGPDAVLELLPDDLLARRWIGSRSSHWLSWSSREAALDGRRQTLPYKLYVSPRIEALPDLLAPLVEALTASSAPRFKIGADAPGLLRPDKIVVYLRDAEETARVGRAVTAALAGGQPHGVPFSAELAGDGLLSWGGDPPAEEAPIGRRSESWRLSVCRRLAESLVAARRAPLQRARPADFALARLAVDGVDVRSFAPTALAPPPMAAA